MSSVDTLGIISHPLSNILSFTTKMANPFPRHEPLRLECLIQLANIPPLELFQARRCNAGENFNC